MVDAIQQELEADDLGGRNGKAPAVTDPPA